MFSNLSFSSISLATETPSLVTVGAPNERSSTTLRPLGPSVTFTASAKMFNPWTILVGAPSWKLTSFAGIVAFSCIRKFAGGLCAFDDAHDVFLAHHEEFITLHLHGLPGVLAEQHSVAGLDVERDQLARVILLALAHGDNLALVGLFGGGVRDDDSTCGPALLFDALDDHAVMQRTDFHARLSIKKRYVLQWLAYMQGKRFRTQSAMISTQLGRVLIIRANRGRFKSYFSMTSQTRVERAARLQSQLPPQRVHAAFHHRVHDDRPAPAPRRLAGPFRR